MTTRLPKALRRGHDDSLACPHRDTCVCPDCARKYAPACFEILARHFWVPDEADRAALMAMAREPVEA
jgi:hypothetical protein